jgi:hypothetical protein
LFGTLSNLSENYGSYHQGSKSQSDKGKLLATLGVMAIGGYFSDKRIVGCVSEL